MHLVDERHGDEHGDEVTVDDELVMYLTKQLRSEARTAQK